MTATTRNVTASNYTTPVHIKTAKGMLIIITGCCLHWRLTL